MKNFVDLFLEKKEIFPFFLEKKFFEKILKSTKKGEKVEIFGRQKKSAHLVLFKAQQIRWAK